MATNSYFPDEFVPYHPDNGNSYGSLRTAGYHRVELDIGSGTGVFLECMAATDPSTLYIGIEIDPDRHIDAKSRLRRNASANAISINYEAHAFLKDHIPSEAIDCVHIYFPNPYPHIDGRENRLVDTNFLAEVNRVLRDGGHLRLATDHVGYFETILRSMSATNWCAINWIPLAVETPCDGLRIGTPCEVRYHAEHRPIYYVQAIAF